MALSRMIPLALLGLPVAALARAGHPHGGAVVVVQPAPAPVIHGDCAPCTTTICVPQTEKVTHTRAVYRCKTKTICLPYCGGRHCRPCDGGECGKPPQVRVLIKRFVKEEHCVAKCKPVEVAAPLACPATPACLPPGGTVLPGGK